jgi:hypothetical protein
MDILTKNIRNYAEKAYSINIQTEIVWASVKS